MVFVLPGAFYLHLLLSAFTYQKNLLAGYKCRSGVKYDSLEISIAIIYVSK